MTYQLDECIRQPSIHTTKDGIYSYSGDKRDGGQLNKDNNYLVLLESKHNQDNSWVHKCGTPVRSKLVAYPIWENRKPKCAFCGCEIELPDNLFHCPFCVSVRTGRPIGTKQTNMPYCPTCETEPISYINTQFFYAEIEK